MVWGVDYFYNLANRQPTTFPNLADHGSIGKPLRMENRQRLGRRVWGARNQQAT